MRTLNQNMKVFGSTRVVLKHTSLPVDVINIRGINSLAVIPRAPSSQGKIDNDLISLPDLETNSLLSQSQIEDAINIVDSSLDLISLEARGTKRSQGDLSSPYLNDNGHLNKKVLKEMSQDNDKSINTPSGLNTEDWVNKTSDVAQIPEESKIPDNYLSEPATTWGGFHDHFLKLNLRCAEAKAEANALVDEINMSRELLEQYMENVTIRVRERIPSEFSEDIVYDSTYESDSEDGNAIPEDNPMGLYLPTDSSDNTESSNDDNSVLGNSNEDNSISGNSNEDNLVPGNSNDANLISGNSNDASSISSNSNDASSVPGNSISSPINPELPDNSISLPINPELADNPELTVHHSSASDDDVLSVNISTDVSDPHVGVGLEPLNNGLMFNEVTYSGMLRQDQHIHSNYMIKMRGIDDMEYRATYDYLIDTLNYLDHLIMKYKLVHYLEDILIRWNPAIEIHGRVLKSEIHNILDLVSVFN